MKMKMMKKTLIIMVVAALPILLSMPRTMAGEDYITVVVKEGDTLYGIALKHLKNPGRYKEIAEYNKLENPDIVFIGMKLKIPHSWLKEPPEKPSPQPQPKPSPTPPEPAPTPSEPAPMSPPVKTELPGTIFHVARDAVRMSAEGGDETLRVGNVVKAGDRIVTDAMSFCSISLGTGRLIVGPDTRLVVTTLDRSGSDGELRVYIEVLGGIVKMDTTAKFDVRVKSEIAVARAKAASFTFRVEEEAGSFIDVYSGVVEVSSGSAIGKASIGQGLIIEAVAKIIGPLDLSSPPMLVKHEVRIADDVHRGAKWDDVPEAVSYRVEVALDAGFERPVYLGGYAGSTIDFNFLRSYPKGRYYIRLISVNKQGLWSDPSNYLDYDNSSP